MEVKPAIGCAGANIALVKYWGKRDEPLNLPAAGSLSITLAELVTTTRLTPDPSLAADELVLDGRVVDPGRVGAVLERLRRLAGTRRFFRVESHNNFPTAAGLASSASAFAALVVAADRLLGLDLSAARLSELARRGSGSAARSVFGGFVEMNAGQALDGSDSVARELAGSEHWPLRVVVAITDRSGKRVSSTDGMNLTQRSSPYYRAWVDSVDSDLSAARAAVAARDFERIAEVAEHSALKMHASAMAARPGLLYWNPATLACMHEIRALRADGVAVFFTVDAGPQVKAVCLPDVEEVVAERLALVPGVVDLARTGLGPGARVIT
jgi:diphosphomevalonate decarboxylase